MEQLYLWIIIGILVLVILILSLSLFLVIKKATYLSKKQKEFIGFAIDMYVNYAEELEITAPEQHEAIVKQLINIKENNLNIE